MAPLEYVKQIRLKKAQTLLADTGENVESIGSAVGYGDAIHFSRQFKAFSGMSPRDYRKQAKNALNNLTFGSISP
jgi:transcriptional regulator GlxA family with amidase domain